MPRHASYQFKAKVHLHPSTAMQQTHKSTRSIYAKTDIEIPRLVQMCLQHSWDIHPLTYRGRSSIQLPSTMIGHNNSLNSMSHCQLCIFFRQDAFDDDGQVGQAPQPVDIIPGDRRIQAVGGQSILRTVISLQP